MFFLNRKKKSAPKPEDELLQQTIARFRQIHQLPRDGQYDQQIRQFHQDLKTLPENIKNRMVYEIAKIENSRSTSGFHGMPSGGVIHACGWANYAIFRWGEAWHDQGVAFRIRRECFPPGPVRLYYLDDDHFPRKDEDNILQLIRQHSSGISNIHLERRVCKGWHSNDEEEEQTLIVFDLDETAFHHTVVLSGKHVPTQDLGGYIFVLPRAGEFYCVLGEIRDDAVIPLHKDDFCMK